MTIPVQWARWRKCIEGGSWGEESEGHRIRIGKSAVLVTESSTGIALEPIHDSGEYLVTEIHGSQISEEYFERVKAMLGIP